MSGLFKYWKKKDKRKEKEEDGTFSIQSEQSETADSHKTSCDLMSIDGKSHSIKQGQEIVIKKADFMINVIKFENNNFLDTIRNKMLWGIDKRN